MGACKDRADETLAGFAPTGSVYVLEEWAGNKELPHLTLHFERPGRISGKAPCNTFSGLITAPYPWFDLEDLEITKVACPSLSVEIALLSELRRMTIAEVSGDIIMLSSDQGITLTFMATQKLH